MTFLEFCRRYVCEFDADDVVDVVIDLKVLVKSFNREDHSCYAGNPRERFLCEFAKYFLICDSFAKVGYYYHCVQSSLLRATTPAARGSGRRMVPYIYLSLHR